MSGTPVPWAMFAYGNRYEAYKRVTDTLTATYGAEAWPCSVNAACMSADRHDSASMVYLDRDSVRTVLGLVVDEPGMSCRECEAWLRDKRYGFV